MASEELRMKIFEDKISLGKAAAEQAGNTIRHAIRDNGKACIVAATGSSQFEFLDALTSLPGIEWKAVEMFHLDEYIGLPETHPASFRKYLRERLIDKVALQ